MKKKKIINTKKSFFTIQYCTHARAASVRKTWPRENRYFCAVVKRSQNQRLVMGTRGRHTAAPQFAKLKTNTWKNKAQTINLETINHASSPYSACLPIHTHRTQNNRHPVVRKRHWLFELIVVIFVVHSCCYYP